MEANKYGYVAVEIVKENYKFQLMLPWGCPWEVCHAALEDYQQELANMEAIAKAPKANEVPAEPVKE